MAKDPERRDLFSGALDLMILHSLGLKPMHGYALVKHIKQASDDLLKIEEGSLYPALQRLLKEGLLESESRDFGEGASDPHLSIDEIGGPAPGTRSEELRENVHRDRARAHCRQGLGVFRHVLVHATLFPPSPL